MPFLVTRSITRRPLSRFAARTGLSLVTHMVLVAVLTSCGHESTAPSTSAPTTTLPTTPPVTSPAVAPKWAAIDAGGGVTCALTTEGRAYCWGDGWGVGEYPGRFLTVPAPRELPGGRRWTSIDVGDRIACGIATDTNLYCWGGIDIPYTSKGADSLIRRVDRNPGFVSVSAGLDHVCGLRADGIGYCFGRHLRGQLGAGRIGTDYSIYPVQIATDQRFTTLRAGNESSCGLVATGDLYCWGSEVAENDANTPRVVQSGLGLTDIALAGGSVGRTLVCGQRAAAAAYCARYEPNPRLPRPPVAVYNIPGLRPAGGVTVGGTELGLIDPFAQVFPRGIVVHVCALDTPGQVWCWGTSDWPANGIGQLGDGTTNERLAPAPVIMLGNVASLSAGGAHTCALTRDATIYCWGANNRGQLGLGRFSNSESTPQRVPDPLP